MVTVIETISADGHFFPCIYLQRLSTPDGMAFRGTKEGKATFAWLPKGWTDCELGLEWVEHNIDHFTRDI
jgi:hypothetical protein